MVRLDAVGYTVKTAGTSCFLTPDTFAFVDELAAEAHGLGLEVLAEVHAHHRFATEAAAHVDRVYDFALAPLVLHTVFTGDAAPLRRWLTTRPHNAVTVLDTHDGIGVQDVDRIGDIEPFAAPARLRRLPVDRQAQRDVALSQRAGWIRRHPRRPGGCRRRGRR